MAEHDKKQTVRLGVCHNCRFSSVLSHSGNPDRTVSRAAETNPEKQFPQSRQIRSAGSCVQRWVIIAPGLQTGCRISDSGLYADRKFSEASTLRGIAGICGKHVSSCPEACSRTVRTMPQSDCAASDTGRFPFCAACNFWKSSGRKTGPTPSFQFPKPHN